MIPRFNYEKVHPQGCAVYRSASPSCIPQIVNTIKYRSIILCLMPYVRRFSSWQGLLWLSSLTQCVLPDRQVPPLHGFDCRLRPVSALRLIVVVTEGSYEYLTPDSFTSIHWLALIQSKAGRKKDYDQVQFNSFACKCVFGSKHMRSVISKFYLIFMLYIYIYMWPKYW